MSTKIKRFIKTSKKLQKQKILSFYGGVLFYLKSKVFFKFFALDCRFKITESVIVLLVTLSTYYKENTHEQTKHEIIVDESFSETYLEYK